MWRNSDFAAFVEQLRAANLSRPPEQRVGLYGADVYDLFEAADAVVAHLGTLDRAAMQRARAQYRCLNGHGRDLHRYGEAAQSANRSCAVQAAAALDLVRRLPRPREPQAAEAHFAAIRAAASVVAAEEYIRTIHAGEDAWNLRDRRMADTVDAIAAHAARLTGREGRVVLWAHNSHVGDARATAAAAEGQLNIGQVMKERHGARTLLVGFLTHSGTVRAAPAWDQPDREFTLRNARSDSHGGLFHQTGLPSFMLLLSNPQLSSALAAPMLQRAVGVVYAPETELQSHYGAARLPAQFDALIYFDRTRAVRRL
jgi:erythromycin esterase-like protein